MSRYEAKIELVNGAIAPDLYDPSTGKIPPDTFVVSRNKDGSTASVYGDLSWNRTPYDPDGASKYLHFRYWKEGGLTAQRHQLIREMHWVIFLFLYMRVGTPLSHASIDNYLLTLRQLARICERRSIRLQEILSDPLLMFENVDDCPNSATTLGPLLTFLTTLGSDVVGYEVQGAKTIKQLREISRQWMSASKQTSPIPTRIYSKILSTLSNELDEFDKFAEPLLKLYQACRADPFLGRDPSRQRVVENKTGLKREKEYSTFSAILDSAGLSQYFHDRGYAKTVHRLSYILRETLLIASIQIQAFTGMRHNEVNSLRYDCIDCITRDGLLHYIIKGRVTKLSHGLKRQARWVTSDAGRRAVLIAQRISSAIYASSGIDLDADTVGASLYPLFIAPQLLGRTSVIKTSRLNLNEFQDFRNRVQPLITDSDLGELEDIDPHRAWRSENDYQVGKPWTFGRHQLRRSLALYAQRSGLVSLPSLKRQLHHITQEMAMYYAKGSIFAKNFINDTEEHFGYEWQEAQPVSQFLSYVSHVLLTDEALFGVHPDWIDARLRNSDGLVLFDREVTLTRFKKGQLAYRETPIGGCVNVDECDITPHNLLEVECLTTHCKNLVGSLKKLERVIAVQKNRVDRLRLAEPGSPQLSAEESDLAVLVATRDNVLCSKQCGKSDL